MMLRDVKLAQYGTAVAVTQCDCGYSARDNLTFTNIGSKEPWPWCAVKGWLARNPETKGWGTKAEKERTCYFGANSCGN